MTPETAEAVLAADTPRIDAHHEGPMPRLWSEIRTRLDTRRVGTATRLAALYAMVLAAVLAGFLAALLHTTTVGIQQIAVRQLEAELSTFQLAAASRPAGESLRSFANGYLASHAVADGDLIEVADPSHWAVANAGGSAIASNSGVQALAEAVPSRTSMHSLEVAGRQREVLIAPIRIGNQTAGVFVAAVDTSSLKPAVDTAARLAILVGAVALIAGVLSTYLVLRRLLRRIGRIADTADRIGRDQIADRLGDQGTNDEVGDLARSFDSMLDRIEGAVQAQHELLSDVSHQLRTPLTVARGHLELLGRKGGMDRSVSETVDTAIAELDRMAHLVDRTLILGRAREPVRYDERDVDLRAFLGDLMSASSVLALRSWEMGPVPDEVLRFDEAEVRGALLNLIDNAVHATQTGDTIQLSAAVRRIDASSADVTFRVDDAGHGIPVEERSRVLDRFARTTGRSNGTGLGLAIVGAVCAAHGGTVTIEDSPLGGTAVIMRIHADRASRTLSGEWEA